MKNEWYKDRTLENGTKILKYLNKYGYQINNEYLDYLYRNLKYGLLHMEAGITPINENNYLKNVKEIHQKATFNSQLELSLTVFLKSVFQYELIEKIKDERNNFIEMSSKTIYESGYIKTTKIKLSQMFNFLDELISIPEPEEEDFEKIIKTLNNILIPSNIKLQEQFNKIKKSIFVYKKHFTTSVKKRIKTM